MTTTDSMCSVPPTSVPPKVSWAHSRQYTQGTTLPQPLLSLYAKVSGPTKSDYGTVLAESTDGSGTSAPTSPFLHSARALHSRNERSATGREAKRASRRTSRLTWRSRKRSTACFGVTPRWCPGPVGEAWICLHVFDQGVCLPLRIGILQRRLCASSQSHFGMNRNKGKH